MNSRGEKIGLKVIPPWNFSKNSSVLVPSPAPNCRAPFLGLFLSSLLMPSLKGFRIKVKPANILEQLLNEGGGREKAAQLQLWQEEYLLKLRGNLVEVLSLAFI